MIPMKKLLKNKKGFTLMEMLIVVAIIVILVAISVPTFNNSLNGAKQQTDAANMRAAKVVANSQMMLAETETDADEIKVGYVYDAENSKFVDPTKTTVAGYGQYDVQKDEVIKVTEITDGVVKLAWTDTVDPKAGS